MTDDLRLSSLPKTWFIDVDGVIVEHNGWQRGRERLLPGVERFWGNFGAGDRIILVTARTEEQCVEVLRMLDEHGLRYDGVIHGVPPGERVLINDRKPSGLRTAWSVNVARDAGFDGVEVVVDGAL